MGHDLQLVPSHINLTLLKATLHRPASTLFTNDPMSWQLQTRSIIDLEFCIKIV